MEVKNEKIADYGLYFCFFVLVLLYSDMVANTRKKIQRINLYGKCFLVPSLPTGLRLESEMNGVNGCGELMRFVGFAFLAVALVR